MCLLRGDGASKAPSLKRGVALGLGALGHGGDRRRGRGNGLLSLGLCDVREGFAHEDLRLVPKKSALEVDEGFPCLRARI